MKCDLCGKSPMFGHNVSHSKRRTNTRSLPNIHPVSVVINGEKKIECGQLEGRFQKRSIVWSTDEGTPDRVKAEWVIAAPQGGLLKIEARHARAGTVRREVELK